MAYTVTIFSPSLSPSAGYSSSEALALEGGGGPAVGDPTGVAGVPGVAPAEPPLRRLKRIVAYGPRCPDCAGPLVFGEGCQLCPVCGYSGCGPRR